MGQSSSQSNHQYEAVPLQAPDQVVPNFSPNQALLNRIKTQGYIKTEYDGVTYTYRYLHDVSPNMVLFKLPSTDKTFRIGATCLYPVLYTSIKNGQLFYNRIVICEYNGKYKFHQRNINVRYSKIPNPLFWTVMAYFQDELHSLPKLILFDELIFDD